MRTLLILLLLCGTAWAKEDCQDNGYWENSVERSACREANALEDIATTLNKIAEEK